MLVIIGLIIGGVLVGQDLISAAATRAQMTQIEKFNTATNTFRVKYGYIPGDIPDPYASQFGFLPRGQYRGEGDGNGVIEGSWGNAAADYCSACDDGGETVVLWVDLSMANLIAELSAYGQSNTPYSTGPYYYVATAGLPLYLPAAKIGNGNYIYVWSGGINGTGNAGNGLNYYGLSVVSAISLNGLGTLVTSPGLTVVQAYNIDKKIDDGLPQSGKVTAMYPNNTINPGYIWAAGGGVAGASPGASATGSITTCYDNAGGSGTMQYSMEISNGSNMNCALSFQMQGAAR